MSLRLNKVSTQDYIMQSLIETGTVVHVFLPFWYYIHLEKGMALHLKKIQFRSPEDALCQIWLKYEIGPMVLEINCKFCKCIYYHLPWKK